MKETSPYLLLIVILGIAMQSAAQSGLDSLRRQPIDADSIAVDQKKWQPDRDPIPRDYVQQPPLVPHSIEGYEVNLKSNKCLTCHSWANYKEAGATKISQTHFRDRELSVRANVAGTRYFCTQCHVPQVNARPLVENQFEPVDAIKQR
jgi:cytochrome c-type protein NapB